MPYFCVSHKNAQMGESYWLHASTEEEARTLVARSVDDGSPARAADDRTTYDCSIDDSKTPPRRFIYRQTGDAIEKR
jgi:hypothetical protein